VAILPLAAGGRFREVIEALSLTASGRQKPVGPLLN